jgi:uncharacterized protein (TIGR02757 family)
MAGWNNEIDPAELKSFLDEKATLYNTPRFIQTDPIQVPHTFTESGDIEISAFLTAALSWGRKATIISNARKLMAMMPGGPHAFLLDAGERDLAKFLPFVHRTFNGIDCIYFLKALSRIYRDLGGLETVFSKGYAAHGDLAGAIIGFREVFFQVADPGRTAKHLPDLQKNSAGKRLNMFLRWMVRRDPQGVDFGIWDQIPMHALYIPLDVHSGSVARKLGLLNRKQNDWSAVEELTSKLQEMDPADPVRYDYALFGLGSFEQF